MLTLVSTIQQSEGCLYIDNMYVINYNQSQ
jgi:hypothetical protein